MLMNYHHLVEEGKYYRQSLMRQAQNDQLAQQLSRTGQRRSLLKPVLAWAGRRLLASGLYLLSRAGDVQYEYRSVRTHRA